LVRNNYAARTGKGFMQRLDHLFLLLSMQVGLLR
jgi:hypothetical protein